MLYASYISIKQENSFQKDSIFLFWLLVYEILPQNYSNIFYSNGLNHLDTPLP